jgi:hypothetical protein
MDFNLSAVSGNGNVVSIDRTLDGAYTEIEIGRGLDLYLTQGDTESITVQADENLHDIIITEIKGNVLKIYADENINSSSAKKVMLQLKEIARIESYGGADVFSTNTITLEKLALEASSGSDMDLNVATETLNAESSSGANLKLSGSTNKLFLKSTSGSNIQASKLASNICNAYANSGAHISLKTKDKLFATASSGGNIKYIGSPSVVEKSEGVSGSIRNN